MVFWGDNELEGNELELWSSGALEWERGNTSLS
jgi:hypothetical protein